MTIRRASSRVSLSRSAVWTRRALDVDPAHARIPACAHCLSTSATRAVVSAVSHSERPPRARPVQPHRLPGADLGDLVDVLVGHHADDRIAAGDRMVGPEDHRKTVRRHLDCAAGRALAGQLTVRPAVLQRHADQPHADPVAAVGDLPVGADQDVGIDEPVVARTGHHPQFQHFGPRSPPPAPDPIREVRRCARRPAARRPAEGAADRSPTSRRRSASPAPAEDRCRRAPPGSVRSPECGAPSEITSPSCA